jgi:hypothetical protein
MMSEMPVFGIAVPYNDDHHEQCERTGAMRDGYEPCIVCGRAVNVGKNHWRVRVHDGGSRIMHDTEADKLNELGFAASELGSHPIGPDCLKKHPEVKPYAVRVPSIHSAYEPDGLLTIPGFGTSQY